MLKLEDFVSVKSVKVGVLLFVSVKVGGFLFVSVKVRAQAKEGMESKCNFNPSYCSSIKYSVKDALADSLPCINDIKRWF